MGQGARGELSRSWALLQIEDGSFTKITRKTAFELIDAGDFQILRQRPLSISLIQHKDFQDEQRHASGRRIPGVTKPPFNGKSSTSSGIRCRPPRSCVNWEYVKTSIMAKQFETERQDRIDEEEKKEARKQNRRRRRARRRRRKK